MPPCSVELLLYSDSRLFVVLPTGVTTKLPFGINAPFVQDTARLKIKDPDSSPTNRWLLERVGKLAVDSMLAWLRNEKASPEFRAKAYDLMPDVGREATSPEGSCAATVEIAFESALKDHPFIFTTENILVSSGDCIEVHNNLMDVWPSAELTRILNRETKALASQHLSDYNLQKLRDWQAIIYIERSVVVEHLKRVQPAKPNSWRQMLTLWSYLYEDMPNYDWGSNNLRELNIVPVQGQQSLFSANAVIRLGEKRLLASEDDWEFLFSYLKAYNPNWSRFLAEQRKIAESDNNTELKSDINRAYKVQSHLKLEETGDTNQIFSKVAIDFYSTGQPSIAECVRFAQIAARLGVVPDKEFRFVTRNGRKRSAEDCIIADETGQIADIVPEAWAEDHLLHDSYWVNWTSCARQEWLEWIKSSKAKLQQFPPLTISNVSFLSRKEFHAALQWRGYTGKYERPYKTQHFEIEDIDFEDALWSHWEKIAVSDNRFWVKLLNLIIEQGPVFWDKSLEVDAFQVATTGRRQEISPPDPTFLDTDPTSGILPGWILRLRELPCITDNRGSIRKPSEVMLRTTATEALLDVEPFISKDLDTWANNSLLIALGVRDKPTGPVQIIERIQALAETDTPPIEEVDKWYRRLDSLFLHCTSEETREVRESFESEPLIFSATHGWVRSQEIFISATADDIPDTPLIRSSVRDLELWRRIHVADRPNAELILKWLSELPTEETLPSDQVKRIKGNLARLGSSAWEQSGHWLNLSNQLVRTSEINYSVSMQSLTKTQELFPEIKRVTADFTMLDVATQADYPFTSVPPLAKCLDEQVTGKSSQTFLKCEKPWLECLAKNLSRIKDSSEAEQEKLVEAANRLCKTEWRQGKGLETIPYLDGVPVGASRKASALWSNTILYVEKAPLAHQAGPVAHEINRGFNNQKIGEAVKFCFERDLEFITQYMEQEFTLVEQQSDSRTEPDEPVIAAIETAADQTEHPVIDRSTSAISDAPQDESTSLIVEEELESASPTQPASVSTSKQKPRNSGHSDKPSLIERYATSLGLYSDGNGKFIDGKGTVLLCADNSIFQWELRDEGELRHRLFTIEQCLETTPIKVDSEVWSLLHGRPESHALIVLASDGTPSLITGSELMMELDEGRIKLYPASYRLSRIIV